MVVDGVASIDPLPDMSADSARPDHFALGLPQRRRWRRRIAVAAVVVCTVLAAGLVVQHLIPSHYGTMRVYQLHVGDCIKGELVDRGFRLSPCNAQHDAEILAMLVNDAPPSVPYPGDGALNSYIHQQCEPRFADYVGTAFADSSLRGETFSPNSSEWKDGERRYVCAALAPPDATLGQSVRGTHR